MDLDNMDEPLEELVLELTDLNFQEQDGVPHASARARLVYQPATPGQPHVHSAHSWRFVAPIRPLDLDELGWYLEDYATWPGNYFRNRARKVEENLVKWGQVIYEAAMPVAHTANVKDAWARSGDHAGRRFSVLVDSNVQPVTANVDIISAKEVATILLGLPWELLHDGDSYLFQGAKPVRVRRRLPNTEVLDVAVVETPIRILLITARPEDDSCSYIDHRTSALPLVEAMESLSGMIDMHVLREPTFPAFRAELDRARKQREPFHVVHFDGHGGYDSTVGLGGLCFEDPADRRKLENRRHVMVFTNELGPLLGDHRIPLVFLEACQTAKAEKASESVASALLKVGVASVVAMSHSVLVETSGRFVRAFYEALVAGKRVGDAMLAGQRRLKDDSLRERIFGMNEFRLDDWFVPVLYQAKDDPQLFKPNPTQQTREDCKASLSSCMGNFPRKPESGFVGRSRELLALQRLLTIERYAIVRGQGGEGKTALAAEFGRWMIRSHQIRRAAFVSVDGIEKNVAEFVLDKLGHQLIKPRFSTQVDCKGDLVKAEQELERVLRVEPTLVVIDNMEAVLLPSYVARNTPDVISEEAREELHNLLALCQRLLKVSGIRLIFTSRERLPDPFLSERHTVELWQLDPEDAVKLVERVLNAEGKEADSLGDTTREEIDELVDAVHCHARTLTLLAPSLRRYGVDATREALVELMVEMDNKFPGNAEQSVFASVALSLRRMSRSNRDRARVLGVFHGAVNLDLLQTMTQWEASEVASLAADLIATGLATSNANNHLNLDPALCPYLRVNMDRAESESLTNRWIELMRQYVQLLRTQQNQQIEIATTLTVLDLPNLLTVLDLVQRGGDVETTIDLAASLLDLLRPLGKYRLVKRVAQIRDVAAGSLGDTWNHARFEALKSSIDQQRTEGLLSEAYESAKQLLRHARAAGEQAYPGADYDLAMACIVLAREMNRTGRAEQALALSDEARQRFELCSENGPVDGSAEGMLSFYFAVRGDSLYDLGKFDEAAHSYEEALLRSNRFGDERQVAAVKSHLGNIRLAQRRYPEALAAYEEARNRFTQLNEPRSVSVMWHHIGMTYQQAGRSDAADNAFRESLAISVWLGDIDGEANTLNELASLYDEVFDRPEDAADFFRQAVEKTIQIGDVAKEGTRRSNLAGMLLKLNRLLEAREEICRAIECKKGFGHAAEPWKSWLILAQIETRSGNPSAAAEAKSKAIDSYVAYRRDGGESYNREAEVGVAVTKFLLSGDKASAMALLHHVASESNLPRPAATFVRVLQAIVAGSRDRTLADNPDLGFHTRAEILLLIDTLESIP
jgi:tetratricopeptide (TPR) repeat protein